MAADMEDRGTIVACDVRPRRVALLEQTVRESGARNVEVRQVQEMADFPADVQEAAAGFEEMQSPGKRQDE